MLLFTVDFAGRRRTARTVGRLLLGFVPMLLLAGCHSEADSAAKGGLGGKGGPPRGPAVVDVRVVHPTAVADTIEAAGTVLAVDQVELHPEATGRLTALAVAEGQRVAAGTVVARVNDADLQAQLAKTQANLEVARKSVGRLEKLLAMQGVNQADYDLAVAQVRSGEADADYTRALLAKTVVRTPFAGVLGLRQVSPGAYVTPATVIATLQRADRVKVDFTLPEPYADRAPTNSRVVVVAGGSAGGASGDGASRRYVATVVAREPQVSATTRNLTVRALLPVGATLSPGSFVRVRLGASGAGATRTGVWLPTSALLPGDRADQVIVVRGGKALPVDVQTGPRTADRIAILSGLSAGDTVVVSGVLFAQAGKPVKVRKVSR
ncbi:MAG: efflux RND transporter periplasmic adaptor subunit [Hymenobacteraceae bacterium]|nr:efflux RND transporter periplasmic adaptor subunit [Hymenobacteraceae bacterium]